MTTITDKKTPPIKKRFDGFLPVVVDLETGGVIANKHALLEIAAMRVEMDTHHHFSKGALFACHVEPFPKAELDPAALEINHIDPFHPFRFAIPESTALAQLFKFVNKALHETHCRRALLVGHNAHFDLGFIQAACKRCQINNNPFHSFSVLDTATLGGLVYGKTVLAKACDAADISFNRNEAHSAIYDVERTAELFCKILNQFP